MHKAEIKNILEKFIPKLEFQISRQTGNETQINNFNIVIETVQYLNDIESLKLWTMPILENDIVNGNQNVDVISIIKDEAYKIINNVKILKKVAEMLHELLEEDTPYRENSLLVKLPALKSFEDLSKIANEFKIALEVPLHDSNETLEINKAEDGSIWLVIATSIGGVQLISKLVNIALKIAKVNVQLKMHNEQSRTIGLKNDLLEMILDQQKKYLDGLLEEETKTIFDPKVDNETFKRYKTSVDTLANLIERGAEIQPAQVENEEIKHSFPNFKEVNLLGEYFIKKIENTE